MKLRDAYRQRIEAQIEEETARIAMLKAKAKRLAADAQIVAMEEIAETEKRLSHLKSSLSSYVKAGESAVADLKAGVEKASEELGKAVQKAAKRFSA